MSQLSHAQFPLRRHPDLLVDHRRARSAAVDEPRGANVESRDRLRWPASFRNGGRLHFGMVTGIKSERWPTSNRNPWPDCVGIRRIDDVTARRFGEDTQRDYVRAVKTFTVYLGRSPDKASAEDLRRYQLHLAKQHIGPGSINAAGAALRFFFKITLE